MHDNVEEVPPDRPDVWPRKWVTMEALEGMLESAPPQWRDEVKFLMTVTRLQPRERLVLNLWTEGWGQCETSRLLQRSQQWVSWTLRRALTLCLAMEPVSFSAMCRKPVYRRPQRVFSDPHPRFCVFCGSTRNPDESKCPTCRRLRELRTQNR